jgi:uncharacterized membrane protein HdeD (DUF308 family)
MKKEKTKLWLSVILLIVSLIFGLISLMSPPKGVIDSSVLLFVGEALAFVAAVLGIEAFEAKK